MPSGRGRRLSGGLPTDVEPNKHNADQRRLLGAGNKKNHALLANGFLGDTFALVD